ncbi:MAG: hypothetical protein HXN55_07635 [Prevotella nigrescens]|uniref:Lipoprotein n=1 Tax=Prevotella nigrescens TaxID=28133 RepID=A0A9D5WYS6_9BACT|nr:hypothetical protein [Prevotella nigrescens]MBF1404397.1 hypothetical protein [Prevotella histicola]MBF1447234.1 hypothetical protein [Prevotella nigrescens]DAS13802.1 MAG TPA: Prokaryotic membrane lipoprotein lipid attachment site [Caudoviricetes sp.]
MKKIFYSLLCIIGLSACSSENVVLDSLKVYDVANSTCKSSLSATETRPDFYLENDAVPATLSIELGKDGIAQCVLEDVKANCAVRNIYVNIVNQDDQITLFVYHNVLDALADCICKYDVSFKMSKLSAGNYKLKVYFARPNMKYEESDIAFNGLLNLTLNKKERVVLKSELSLPEI